MAKLDVSDVLNDPLFMNKNIVCIRNDQTINDKGRAVNTQNIIGFSGVVTSNNGMQLDRLPDGSIVSGAINIITKFHLSSGTDNRDADEILWKDKTYIVHSVDNYQHFGRGFVQAVCTLKPFAGT
ncbi:MAG: hypothetical protein ACK5LJ_15020 [Paracoccus sp. (in: a-proteobacteria)]